MPPSGIHKVNKIKGGKSTKEKRIKFRDALYHNDRNELSKMAKDGRAWNEMVDDYAPLGNEQCRIKTL